MSALRPDRDDAVAANGNGLRNRRRLFERHDLAVAENQIRLLPEYTDRHAKNRKPHYCHSSAAAFAFSTSHAWLLTSGLLPVGRSLTYVPSLRILRFFTLSAR